MGNVSSNWYAGIASQKVYFHLTHRPWSKGTSNDLLCSSLDPVFQHLKHNCVWLIDPRFAECAFKSHHFIEQRMWCSIYTIFLLHFCAAVQNNSRCPIPRRKGGIALLWIECICTERWIILVKLSTGCPIISMGKGTKNWMKGSLVRQAGDNHVSWPVVYW